MTGFLLLIKVVILGIVEGLTEFLPVSSTGHLILFGQLLDFEGSFATSFQIMIQLGAILAVVAYYRKKIFQAFRHLGRGQWGRSLFLHILIAVAPSLVAAVLLESFIKGLFSSILVVGASLILGAFLLLAGELASERRKLALKDDLDALTWRESLSVGIFQCLALIPGMSRSGSTISGGLFLGLSPRLAAELSFFMAIPVMAGAFVFEASDLVIGSLWEGAALALGFLVSFLVAYGVVGPFLSFISRHRFRVFVWYRLLLGGLLLGLIGLGVIQ